MTKDHIGYIVRSQHVRCRDCEANHNHDLQATASLFRSNIGPYMQRCHHCLKVLVEGLEGWPELFEPDKCQTCEQAASVILGEVE